MFQRISRHAESGEHDAMHKAKSFSHPDIRPPLPPFTPTCSIDIPAIIQEARMATDTLATPAIIGSSTKTKTYKNFIDGEWVESSTGETFENRNPADTREVVGLFQKSAKADVDAAVEAATHAFTKWRLVPAPRRAEIMFRAAEMLLERKEEYSRDMTREMGKILKETRGDTQEAIDTAYYFAGEGRRLFGPTTPSELPNKFAMAVRSPDRRLRHDHAVELSHGDSVMEDSSRHRLRQYLRDQASAGHAALDFQPGANLVRRRRAQRRDQHRHRIRFRCRRPAHRASRCQSHLADRFHRGRDGP